MGVSPDLQSRLWRVRKRHDHIDAVLQETDDGWQLQFGRNDRSILVWRFGTQVEAQREAERRLRELQRAGWTEHW
jgi:hypothetical protein